MTAAWLFRLGSGAVVACLVLAGCTGAEPPEPVLPAPVLPEGHVECPPAMRAQFPHYQCVAPEHAVRLGAGCSAHGNTCVLPVPGGNQASATAQDLAGAISQIECPPAPFDPATLQPITVYTPPCTRQSMGGSGAYRIYDGRGILIAGGTP